MYTPIGIKCQSKQNPPNCEQCTQKDECKTYQTQINKPQPKKDTISVVSSENVGVWENWRKRKSLPS